MWSGQPGRSTLLILYSAPGRGREVLRLLQGYPGKGESEAVGRSVWDSMKLSQPATGSSSSVDRSSVNAPPLDAGRYDPVVIHDEYPVLETDHDLSLIRPYEVEEFDDPFMGPQGLEDIEETMSE
ncbi:hypothetical protein NUU61_001567 [Penicillium alfredii]|uniref:Uncharacterized protein n=1 Tax=Penicillium alfredii TaxID=1506179 RepID=A0A9W9G5Y3_9EURO|nr:uncharacterized protein NUU61_001306 [Penicillium alfredii]XP_056515416.1 uncharacterized protein NUU61_001567 [Penicillium alfredii]KAJ5111676.1 hypothetical protein NUU61_001306 [Penicillium alfredii]KAJ5111937.1 hypothetical protein NUU61_001567 [Penicillium alfredii]